MAAYLLEIPKPRWWCNARALVQVFNTYNSSAGYFCRKHGAAKVRELNRSLDERAGRTS